MEIIAHRGASYDAPENTLASVRLAWEQGADAVEVDVHLSRDNRVVVMHDADTKRIAGVKHLVRDLSLAELQKLDCGRWKSPKFAGERLASLEDVVATIPSGKRMLVEIKTGAEIVRHFPAVPSNVAPISFDLEAIAAMKAARPDLQCYWVVAWRRDWKRGGWLPKPAQMNEQALAKNLDGLDVGANGPVTAAFVKKSHAAGLKVYVWTVDSVTKARQLREAGVDGIATNRPGWIRGRI
ncbi:MAG TPA: glycerophosphodiester phosphodiesterase [Verrucomicrobiae bacterium]|nr:glycerophosphodiester phosphodiesterase [Verrucomicrobiae bacterium]